MPGKRKTILYSLLFLMLAVSVAFIYYYRGKIGKVFIPFIMAIVISYLLHPLVIKLENKKSKDL